MRLAPVPTWALLELTFCVCLLFGNADVNTESEKMAPRQKVQDREPPTITKNLPSTTSVRRLPIKLQNILQAMKKREPRNYPFPIISKGGVLYYDLARVEDTELEIFKNADSVRGITATQGQCKVESLHLGVAYLLDEDLLTHCHQMNLTLEGKDWQCVQEGRMLQQRKVVVDMTLANCSDAWNDNISSNKVASKYGMKEGIQKFEEFGITRCSAERCTCRWYFKEDSYIVDVNCEGVGLTDDMLPKLPSQVQRVNLMKNELRSMDKVIQHLLPYNQNLEVLVLDDNQIQVLPRLPKGSFPRIIDISLKRNRIEKIEIDAFEDLVARKNFIVFLSDNPFRCDCVMYHFKDYLHQQCMKGSEVCKSSYMELRCKYKNENKTIPVHAVSQDGCITNLDWKNVDWLQVLNISLGVLNCIMICLIVDLICIVTHIGGKKERRPMMDCVVCALKTPLCFLCRKPAGTGEVD